MQTFDKKTPALSKHWRRNDVEIKPARVAYASAEFVQTNYERFQRLDFTNMVMGVGVP
jgi:hypothetical protein